MTPLEQLYRLEIEFHRRLRTEAPGTGDARSLHTSYALQAGYEPLLAATGRMTGPELTESSLAKATRVIVVAGWRRGG